MIKKIINICIVVILICNIYGCAQTTEDTLVEGMETVETENTDTENEDEADAEEIIISHPEVEESVNTEDIQTEDTVETEVATEDDAESGPGTAIYQER